MNVMKTKATGELQDDKTYLMEKTIQVQINNAALGVSLLNLFDSS